jgi:hypothetical protein
MLDEKARNSAKEILDKAGAGIPEIELKLVVTHLFSMIKNLE